MLKHYIYIAENIFCKYNILYFKKYKVKLPGKVLAVNAVLTHEMGSPILLKTKTCVLQL
jgi:hypothetical protein